MPDIVTTTPVIDWSNLDLYTLFVAPLQLFVYQTIMLLPKLIAAYLIWLIGRWLISLALRALNLFDVKKWDLDDKVRDVLRKVFVPTANVVLILIILDTLGVGSNVVSAIVNALSFTFAIALGLAFGRALEPTASRLFERAKSDVTKS